jgi:hypothetical protein
MDRIELVHVLSEVRERVGLHELKRVVRLGLVVDANHVETCAVVSLRGASSLAIQIEQSHWFPCEVADA